MELEAEISFDCW